MEEKNKSSGIEELLRQRHQIDCRIQSEFCQSVVIMFTDIAGYTRYSEKYGDIATRTMLQKHNDILFPVIEKENGTVLKTVGDAVMASFSGPDDALAAAMGIQEALDFLNDKLEPGRRIQIRIGVHFGKAIKDHGDFFGDTVNVASRIEGLAPPGGILVSKDVRDGAKLEGNLVFKAKGPISVKGRNTPVELYEVARKAKKDNFNNKTSNKGSIGNPPAGWKASMPLGRRAFGIPAAVFLMAVLGIGGYLFFSSNSSKWIETYKAGYQNLRSGNYQAAESLFSELGKNNPRFFEGMAALNYRKKTYDNAAQYGARALDMDPNIMYPYVIQGHIQFDSGKYPEASGLYQKAVHLETPEPWQKAEALYRLGRISSVSGDLPSALDYYDRAVNLDEKRPELWIAKGRILEKTGQVEGALEAYGKARRLDPDDRMAASFINYLEQKQKSLRDEERRARIDALVAFLLKNKEKPKTDRDPWTSRPFSIFFTQIRQKGPSPVQEGEYDLLMMNLNRALEKTGLFELVERDMLDKILEELKIGSSGLADKSTALKIGRLAASRFIALPFIFSLNGRSSVFVKLIETETSAVCSQAESAYEGLNRMDETMKALTRKLAGDALKAFPIRGRILRVDKDGVTINIGSRVGLARDMVMNVFAREMEDDSLNANPVGKLVVTDTGKEQSTAIVVSGTKFISENQRVEVLIHDRNTGNST